MISYTEVSPDGFTDEEYLDVKRCLDTLLSVQAGTQPLDRELGIDYDSVVDYPIPVAENMLSLEIIEKVKRYEPRAEVVNITYTYEEAHISPHVTFKKAEV